MLRFEPLCRLLAAPLLRWTCPDTEMLGVLGEGLVSARLRSSGWQVLGTRVATPQGEVDLWALDRGSDAHGSAVDRVVVFEVKTGRVVRDWRRQRCWLPRERLVRAQRERLRHAAEWLARYARAGAWSVYGVEVLVVQGEWPVARAFELVSSDAG